LEQIGNATAKYAFHISKEEFQIINQMYNRCGIFLHETLLTRSVGLATTRNHILFDLVEDVLQHTISTGIPQQMDKYYDNIILKVEPKFVEDEPKVLTLKDLAFGFNIWLIAIALSITVFVLELIHFQFKIKFRRYLRHFLGKLFVFMLTRQWLENYH
jgi:hypothetical protein